jgi:Ca2+-binding RTX toxin-like protein
VNGGGGGVDVVNLLGSAGADTVTSAANAVTVNTTGSLAIITLGAGIDAVTISTFDNNDNINLSGITVTSTVFGGDGNDTIVGSPQVDSIYGGDGNDILVGGAANDFLYGEEGNDIFGNLTLTPDGVADDAGGDQAFGGEGFDNFVWEPGDGADSNNGGGDAGDIFRFFGNAAANVFALRQGGTPTHFNALIGALVIDNHGIEDVIVDGQGGADTFVVEDLYATEVVSINLNLGAADAAAIDPVTISGRNVADILSVTSSGAGALNVQGLRYNVNLTNAEATDTLTLNGNDGDDQITVAPGAEAVLTTTLNGINGDDRLTGNVAFLNGGGGNDTLIGGAGNQTMDGGAGDDTFVGNGGTDNVGGGAGSSIGDTIRLTGTAGADTISLALSPTGQLIATINGLTTTYADFLAGPIATSGIEQILVQGLAGNDTLTVDSTNGAISIPINFDGGDNADALTVTGGLATADTYQVGPSVTEGTSTIVIGGVTQVVRFNALEPVLDLVAGPLVVVGTNANNAINYTQGSVAANGLVSIDGFETIEFSNKTALTINALAGDDTINLNNAATPTGLTAINVNGGDPTASDALVVNGTAGNDAINYNVSDTVGAGSVAITGAPVVNFTTTEALHIEGQGGTDALTVTSPTGHRTTVTPGAAADSGSIGSQGFGAGTASVPLSYSHIGALGTVTIAGAGDIVEFNGTANSDSVSLSGTTVQITNATSGFVTNLFTLTNVFQVELRGHDGDDTFNLTGTLAPYAGGVVVDGGNPSASDVVNLTGATAAVTVNFGDNTVSGYGSPIELIGVEVLNANAGTNDATVVGTTGDDTLDVTPTGADAVTFRLASSDPAVGSSPVVNLSAIGNMNLDGAAGTNALVFNGTATGDSFQLSRTAGALSLQRGGTQAITPTNTFFSWTVKGGDGSDSFNITETAGGGAINVIELNLEGGAGSNSMSFSTAFGQTYVPAIGRSGSLTGGAATNMTNISTASVTLAAPATSATINSGEGNNHINVVGTAANTLVTSVDNGQQVTFSGTLTQLTVNAGAGDDVTNVTPGLFTGTINVNSGEPSASDSVIVNGTAGNDAITIDQLTLDGGRVTGLAATIVASSTEKLVVNGAGGVDTLTVQTPAGRQLATVTPGAVVDQASIRMRNVAALGGGMLIPIDYLNIGLSAAGGNQLFFTDISGTRVDDLTIEGLASSDNFDVAASGSVDLDSDSGAITTQRLVIVATPGISSLNLNGHDGDDDFTIVGNHPFTDGVMVDGGNPSASDVLNFNGSGPAITMSYGARTVTETASAPVSFGGVEHVNINAAAGNVTIAATASSDLLEVTPGTNAVTARLINTTPDVGSTPIVNASQIGTLNVDLGAGNDELSVKGTTAAEAITVTGALVTVGLSETVNYTNAEAISVYGLQGNDAFTVTPGANPIFIDGGDPIGTLPGDLLTVNAAVGFFPGPESDEGGVITAGGTVSFDHIEALVVAGIVGCPFLIVGTNADDDITVIARDASTTAGANGVQDMTFSINAGISVVLLNQPDLFIDAMAGDDDIVIRAGAPNGADWDVNVRVAGGSPSIGAPLEADRLVLETPNAAAGFDNIVFNPTGADTGNLVMDENANGTYDAAGTDSLITFGSFVFDCPPAAFTYASTAGGVELVQYNGEGAPGVDDNLTINGTVLDDTTVVNPTGIGSGTFTSGGSPLFQFQSFDNLTVNPGANGFDRVEINGTAGPDTVTSNANTVTLGGAVTLGAGIDQLDINTFDGNDNVDLDLQLTGLRKVINLGMGNDTVNLSGVIVDPADPIIYGGDGDDNIVGSPNVDYIYGGSGTDVILGLANNDYIEGGDGNDTITGGTGNDVLHGGDGSDVIIWNNGDNTDVVEGGTGDDRAVVNGAAAGDTFTIFADATNPTRVAFNRTNLVAFALDIADVEELDVNSGTGTDNITVGDLTTTALRDVDLDLGVEAGIADTVTVNGRNVADNVQMTGAGNVMTIAGLQYDIRVINALAADNDDFTFSANSGDDTVAAADSVAGFFTSSDVAANNRFSILGGDGNDQLSGYGSLVGQAGDDTLIGSTTIAAANGNQLLLGGDGDDTMLGGTGNDTFDGGAGVDTILVRGTPGNDSIDIDQTAATTLAETVNGALETDTLVLVAGLRTVERVNVQAGDGNDTIRVQWADSLGTDANVNSLLVNVDGGAGATGDRVGVVDLGTGDLILLEHGNTSDAGAMSIGPGNAEPLIMTYTNVETAQPIPAAGGDVVVFKHDPFEHNNIRTAATYLGANSSINVDPTINPGVSVPFGFPADEDWYRVVAETTGVLDFQVYFRQVATVPSGRPGLPNAGNLDISVTDAAGTVIAGFGVNDASSDERVRIPAVQGQTYYLRVFANGVALNVYNITVMNYAPPVPRDLELLDNPVGDPPPANSDTGRSQFDNVTRDSTPTLVFRLDDGILLNDIQGNSPAGNNPPNGVVIPIPFQAGAGTPGYRIAIFDEGPLPIPGTTAPQVPLGFATFVSAGVYQFTTPVLLDGSHFLTARVQIVDPSAPQQTGFGDRSVALEVIVDTTVPPGFFGQVSLADTTQGLAAASDSGVVGDPATFVDRVTNDTTPSFYGRAEANTIVRVYAESNGVAGLQSTGAGADLFLGLTVADPLDGSNQFPGGQWSFTTPLDLNNPNLGFAEDGARSLYMTAEDLAGNTTADAVADRLNIFLDTAGPQVTNVEITGTPAFNLFGLKPDNAVEGPTPRVDGLTIRVQDLPNRSNLDPNFLYAALQLAVAETPGNFVLKGDHSGIIAIRSIQFFGVAPVDGAIATGRIELEFFAPLPDDRYTLTIKDNVVDPVGNKLDGESNAAEPIGNPAFPSGDGQPGRDFLARFTVDSRPEIGTVSQGLVYVDINGNFDWDPTGQDNDATNRDFVMQIGTVSDAHFAGNFAPAGAAAASGYDKLGVYGVFNGTYSFLIDTDDDGVGDVASAMPPAYQVNGIPVAGNFNAAHPGDEIGLFDGSFWYLDTNGNNIIDLGERIASNFNGIPVVGNFDNDAADELATYDNATNTFHFDLNANGLLDVSLDVRDTLLRFGGLSGFTDRPVAGDLNLDGIDDLGLWVKGRSGQLPENSGEYFFWVSDRIAASPVNVFDAFSPAPLGNDLFAQFGDENALPIFGNFDPPINVNTLPDIADNFLHNTLSPLDVNRDGIITPVDALLVIGVLNARAEEVTVENSIRHAASFDYRKIDTSGNGFVSPIDALAVINFLNNRSLEGEGESTNSGYASEADAYFAQFDVDELSTVKQRRGRR